MLRSLKTAKINAELEDPEIDITSHLGTLLAGCESQLEKQVLLKINELGLKLPDEAQKVIYEGDAPVARADFFYTPNGLK